MFDFVFPRGRKQWEDESAELHSLLHGHIDLKETMFIVARTKVLLVTSQDKSEDYIVAGLKAVAQGRLTEDDARLAFRFLTGLSGPMYSGGDGSSREQAVVIGTTKRYVGIPAEYAWINRRYGPRGTAWTLKSQAVVPGDSNTLDELVIRLDDGSEKTIHFDISSFFRDV